MLFALLFNRLDYANSLLVNINVSDIDRLQRIQNRAARIVLNARKYDHVSPLLKQLHWLPVSKRIMYKVALIVYKSIHSLTPHIHPAQSAFTLLLSAAFSFSFTSPFTFLSGKIKLPSMMVTLKKVYFTNRRKTIFCLWRGNGHAEVSQLLSSLLIHIKPNIVYYFWLNVC